jgi:hypothetical protein
MSLGHAPSIVRDGLVFYVDASNTQKSFKGKPTTNLQLPNIIDWSGTAYVTLLPELSPINTPVYAVTDDVTGTYLARSRSLTVPNDSSTYTYSIYVKKTYGGTSAMLGFNYGIVGGTAVQYNSRLNSDTGSGATDMGTWWRWPFQAVNNSTGNTTLYCDFYPATGLYGGGDNAVAVGTATVSSVMIENGTYMTPFVNGTRSNTQALVDLIGGKVVTANSLTYASNNTFTFNGTTDYCTIASALSGGVTTPFTLSAWAKSTNVTGWQTVIGTGGTLRQIGFSGSNFYYGGNGGGGNAFLNGGAVSANTWCHLTFTFDGTTAYGYLNGVQTTGSIGSNGGTIGSNYLGSYNGGSELLNGSIGTAMIYNRAITSAENLQNFNATRGRFGI